MMIIVQISTNMIIEYIDILIVGYRAILKEWCKTKFNLYGNERSNENDHYITLILD